MSKLSSTGIRSVQSSKTITARFAAMQAANLNRSNISQMLAASEKSGVKDIDLTSKAILVRSKTGDYEEAFELAKWSLKAKPASRKAVVKSFITSRQAPLLVHQVARLKRTDAKNMMKDFFSQGGDIKNVAEWMSAAGSILKTGSVPDDTDGVWGWIKDTAGSVVDAVVGAINTVADAVAAAGKDLAEAVSKVASWTQSKVSDFVESVLRAGKSVASLLNEAAKKGTSAIRKFIQGVIEAGKRGLEVLNWAVNKAESVLRTALSKLEQLLGSFTSVLFEVARMAASKLFAVVRALIRNGKRVIDFVNRLSRLAYSVAKNIMREVRRVGRSVREIMNAIVSKTRYVIRIVVDALRSLGNSIQAMLKEVINTSITRLRNIFGAIKDLGISLLSALNDVAKFVGSQLVKLMRALRGIWTNLKELLEAIARKSISVIKNLLTALLGAGLHLRTVLRNIISNVRAAFQEGLVKGLIEIGKSALTLMKEAVKISASAAAVLFGVILEVFGSHRGLTIAERAEAQKVFGNSIDLDRVKITNASLAADLVMWMNGNRPFVTMYVINYKSGKSLTMKSLIHELTHIWQAEQSGGVYMIEALHSQFFGKGYDLTEQDLRRAKGKLTNLEREQQAVLVSEYWDAEFNGKTPKFDMNLMRPLAKQVYKSSFSIRTSSIGQLQFTPGFRQLQFSLVKP
jgi:phage-related protein